MDLILWVVRFKTCLVYLNDVLIFSLKLKDHIKHVYEVRMLMENARLSLHLRMCQFFRKIFDYLGHLLLPELHRQQHELHICHSRPKFPEDATLLRSFLCPRNSYRRFIEDFSHMAHPLNRRLPERGQTYLAQPPPTTNSDNHSKRSTTAWLNLPT